MPPFDTKATALLNGMFPSGADRPQQCKAGDHEQTEALG